MTAAFLRVEGAGTGPLAGLTFAAKDMIDIAGTTTGAGNPDWARTHLLRRRTHRSSTPSSPPGRRWWARPSPTSWRTA